MSSNLHPSRREMLGLTAGAGAARHAATASAHSVQRMPERRAQAAVSVAGSSSTR